MRRSSTRRAPAGGPDRRALLAMMMKIRRFEEKAAEMYARGRIKGFLHLYIGQEAVAAGAIAAVRDNDYIVSHYREHGHALARGHRARAHHGGAVRPRDGRNRRPRRLDAPVRRRRSRSWAATRSSPATCRSPAASALAEQYKGTDRIAVNFLGDGAVNEGEYHESLNLAAIWKLPVLFIVENNLYGMGTPLASVTAPAEIYRSAGNYGIRSERVDGMDVVAVYEAVERLAAHVRSGNGPAFLEAMCYRFRGHSMADAEFYRTKEEVERWRASDPILKLKARMIEDGAIDEAGIAELQAEADEMVAEAARFAEESPPPPIESLRRDVYKERDDA